ncbi:palmitoyltransferase [Ascochyta clinopodiicola]|nr:palmitoyltransferase [Ascochyta clinopodiicola]
MKVVYIGVGAPSPPLATQPSDQLLQIFNNEAKPAVELTCERELSSYGRFTRGSISEFLTFFAGEVAQRTRPGQRQDVEEKEYTFHAYGRTEGVCGIVITDDEYPTIVAHRVLSKIVDEFVTKYPRTAYTNFAKGSPQLSFPELKQYITQYQDPAQADSIVKIQKELDETKIVLHKTIESVLERGEKIDNLVAKSDGLSAQSKMFYTQAKKQNSCCLVM